MATPCNVWIGEYPGSSEKDGRTDTIDVFEIEHYVHQPIREEDGMPSGVRVHSPLRLVAQVDKATPGLHKALCTAQNLKEVRLDFYRIDPATRAEKKYYVITLKNARVVDCRPYMPMTFVKANEPYRHMVQYSFTYESIEWDWLPDSVIEMDSWRAPG